MHLYHPASFDEFLARAAPLLLAHEGEHGIMLSAAADAARSPALASGSYAVLAEQNGRVVAAALRTTAKLLLSREAAPGGIAALGEDALPQARVAVIGPTDSVAAFAAAAGGRWREGLTLGLHELRRVAWNHRGVAGAWRVAGAADTDTLLRWQERFSEEAEGLPADRGALAADVAERLAAGALHVWEVGGAPAACLAAVGPTPHGIRLASVYTPPELRGRGYASALVARVSQALIDGGRDFVFLYTDLANPISNAIYRRIGYVPVAEARELWYAGAG